MTVCNVCSTKDNKRATTKKVISKKALNNNKTTPMGIRLDGRDLMMLDQLRDRFGVTTPNRVSTIRMCIQKQYEIEFEKTWADLIEDKIFRRECAKYGYHMLIGKKDG